MQQKLLSMCINLYRKGIVVAELISPDKQHFIELMETHADMVLRVCVLYLKNISDAEDAFQDTFVKAYQSMPVFQGKNHEKAWFIRVAINTCKNYLRLSHRRDLELDERISAPEPEQNDVLREIFKLDIKYRRVLYLHYYEGYKTDEIAAMLEIRPATVRSQLCRARDLLKDRLTKEGFF